MINKICLTILLLKFLNCVFPLGKYYMGTDCKSALTTLVCRCDQLLWLCTWQTFLCYSYCLLTIVGTVCKTALTIVLHPRDRVFIHYDEVNSLFIRKPLLIQCDTYDKSHPKLIIVDPYFSIWIKKIIITYSESKTSHI